MGLHAGPRAFDRVRQSLAAHPVPAAWQATLDHEFPWQDQTGGLRLAWDSAVERFTVYHLVPAAILPRERVVQLTTRWSDLPPDKQAGRRLMVSDLQHYWWATDRVDARRLWILQGLDHEDWGGTPARYTDVERAVLAATGQPATPPAPGTLDYQPFDQRHVRQLRARDRLAKAGTLLEAAARAGDPVAAYDRVYRQAFLGWWHETMAPKVAFLEWYTKQTAADRTLRNATPAEAQAAETWRDHYLETGDLPVAV